MLNEARYKQFPLRLPANLYDQLHELSEITYINKTDLLRIALQKMINHVHQSGLAKTIVEVTQ